jgi:hypothetical protein
LTTARVRGADTVERTRIDESRGSHRFSDEAVEVGPGEIATLRLRGRPDRP